MEGDPQAARDRAVVDRGIDRRVDGIHASIAHVRNAGPADLVAAVEEMPSLLDAATEEALRRVGDGEQGVVVTVAKSIGVPGVDDLIAAVRAAQES